jgi:hypothetical protein
MVSVCVALLGAAIVWIFGTLPWLVINYFLCSSENPIACDDPKNYGQQALLVLALDAMLLAIGIFSALQLKSLGRVRR